MKFRLVIARPLIQREVALEVLQEAGLAETEQPRENPFIRLHGLCQHSDNGVWQVALGGYFPMRGAVLALGVVAVDVSNGLLDNK